MISGRLKPGRQWLGFFINDPIGTSYAKSLLHQVDAVALRASDAVAIIKFMHVSKVALCSSVSGARLGGLPSRGNDFLAQGRQFPKRRTRNCAGRNMNITASGGACRVRKSLSSLRHLRVAVIQRASSGDLAAKALTAYDRCAFVFGFGCREGLAPQRLYCFVETLSVGANTSASRTCPQAHAVGVGTSWFGYDLDEYLGSGVFGFLDRLRTAIQDATSSSPSVTA